MILTRDRLIYITLVLSESAWVYAFIAVLGIAGGSNGSPISFFAVVGILGLSVLTYSYIRRKQFQAFEIFYFGATVAGLILAYLVVAASFTPGRFEIDWITQLTGEFLAKGQTFRGVAGGLLAVGMWFRGIRLAYATYPEKSLNSSFRLGLFFIGVAAIIDMGVKEQLNVFGMILIFFAAGLAGLNIGHLVQETSASSQAKTWPKAIGAAVAGVVAIGLVFGSLQQGFLTFVTSPVKFVFDNVVKGILIIVGVPIVLGIEALNSALGGFFGRDIDVSEFASQVGSLGEEEEELGQIVTTTLLAPVGADTPMPSEFLLLVDKILRYGLVAVALFLVSLFLYILARKAAKKLGLIDKGERESLEEMSFASDIGDLFSDLLPNLRDLFRRGARKVFRLPDGPAGVVEALKLYYQMITTAEQNDVRRPEHYTPTEFRSDLRRVFPNELVQPATEAFNRAHYGDIPATDDEIATMRSSFHVVKSGGPAEQTQGAESGQSARFETVTSEAPSNPWEKGRFESSSLSEKSWFTAIRGLGLAVVGTIVFVVLIAAALGAVIFLFG